MTAHGLRLGRQDYKRTMGGNQVTDPGGLRAWTRQASHDGPQGAQEGSIRVHWV